MFILKWGGQLTHSGIEQSIELGKIFRYNLYPTSNDGILRLHSTYRHDLKVYSSDEGRCVQTAAAFCKGLLDLEVTISHFRESYYPLWKALSSRIAKTFSALRLYTIMKSSSSFIKSRIKWRTKSNAKSKLRPLPKYHAQILRYWIEWKANQGHQIYRQLKTIPYSIILLNFNLYF